MTDNAELDIHALLELLHSTSRFTRSPWYWP